MKAPAIHSFRAVAADGRLVRGETHASGLADLELRLRRRGLELVHGEPASGFFRWPLRLRRIPRRELIHFCFHLEQLLGAGVPILDSLADLREATAHRGMQHIIATLLDEVAGGATLSEAATHHPAAFDAVFCSVLRAGEHTGELAPVLRQLASALSREDELLAHARKLAIYPAIVAVVLSIGVGVALVLVVPQLASLFQSTGQQLPLQTRLLIGASAWVATHGWTVPAGAGLSYMVYRATLHARPHLRLQVDGLRLRLPVLGALEQKISLARVAALFALLYAAGVTVLDALRSTETATSNQAIRHSLVLAGQRIAAGQGVAAAFDATGLFPQLVTRMLRVGEHSGRLDSALGNIVYFYERDVRESIERLQASLEPILTVVLGILMLWIVFAVLSPVYDIFTGLPL